jgi:hypothetical protein
MIPAVTTISSSSACYFSTLQVTSGPLALFFMMIAIGTAFISSQLIAFTIRFPTSSWKVAKHTITLNV